MKLFDELKDIEVREEIQVLKSDLERVLDREEEIIREYEQDKQFEFHNEKHYEIYQSLYKTAQEKLAYISLTSKLLQGYIDARENTELNTVAIIRGMYSAALLEIISTTQPNTTTVIDGKGKTFNYLFYHIHNLKNLTLTNLKGNNTLRNAGTNNGSVKNITLTNIKGDRTLYDAGSKGSVKNITLQNITGNDTFTFAGSDKGSASYITLQNIQGNYTLANAGSDEGRATHITLHNITGNYTLYFTGWNGSAEHITLNYIKGDWTLLNAGSNNGSAKNITLTNIQGNNTLANAGSNDGSATHILKEDQLNQKQKSILLQIQTIVETIHTLSLEEQTKAHNKIAKLQKEIFAGET